MSHLYLKRERTHPGSLGRFLRLIVISSAVSRPIVTKSVTEVVAGPVQHLAKSEFQNSKRLPWKSGKGDTPRQPRTFRGHTQAASDIEDTPRQVFIPPPNPHSPHLAIVSIPVSFDNPTIKIKEGAYMRQSILELPLTFYLNSGDKSPSWPWI